MRIASLALLAIAAVQAKNIEDVQGYTFEQYVKDFSREYPAEELMARREIFELNLAKIVQHNNGDSSWKLAVNEFTDRFHSEIQAKKGRNKAMGRTTELNSKAPIFDIDVADLPTDVDWRNKGVMTEPKDQGACGSCWAFATTETVESHVAIATGKLLKLAPQNVVSCTKNPRHCGGTGGCSGAIAELGFDYVHQNGIALEADWPYEAQDGTCKDGKVKKAAKVEGFVKLGENSYTDLMTAVATKGPIAVSVDASSWQFYSSGIYDGCSKTSPDLDHAVQLVGYGTDNGKDYWLVRNSWGPNWGEGGYIRLLRHSDGDKDKWCATDKNTHDGSACDGDPDTATVCGTCGIWYDNSYPTGASLINSTSTW